MTSDPAPEPAGELHGYLQRAELLAELGRYDDATAELGSADSLAPTDPRVPALLARVHLAAGRPAEALAATDRLLGPAGGMTSGMADTTGDPTGAPAAPGDPTGLAGLAGDPTGLAGPSGGDAGADPARLRTQVVRGFALADLRRFAEAADIAQRLLVAAPADAYAQRSGAAILAVSRNGQPALNAAWRGVELAPGEAQAHLVLSLVAARLGLFDLAERAYREALRLDPELGEAAHDVGVLRLERRRHAAALEEAVESAVPGPNRPEKGSLPPPGVPAWHPEAPPQPIAPPYPGSPDPPGPPHPGGPVAPAGATPPRGPDHPGPSLFSTGPSPWGTASLGDGLRRLVLYGAGYAVVTAVLLACLAAGQPGLSRVVAALAAVVGGMVLWVLAARTPELVRTVLPRLLHQDRPLALAGYAALAGPALILLYAAIGTPWPLVLAIAVTALAELVVLRRPLPPPVPPGD